MIWPRTGLPETQVLVSNRSSECTLSVGTVMLDSGNAAGIDQFGDESLFNSLRPINGYITGKLFKTTYQLKTSYYPRRASQSVIPIFRAINPKIIGNMVRFTCLFTSDLLGQASYVIHRPLLVLPSIHSIPLHRSIVDHDSDGRINLSEFRIAMGLIRKQKAGPQLASLGGTSAVPDQQVVWERVL